MRTRLSVYVLRRCWRNATYSDPTSRFVTYLCTCKFLLSAEAELRCLFHLNTPKMATRVSLFYRVYGTSDINPERTKIYKSRLDYFLTGKCFVRKVSQLSISLSSRPVVIQRFRKKNLMTSLLLTSSQFYWFLVKNYQALETWFSFQ